MSGRDCKGIDQVFISDVEEQEVNWWWMATQDLMIQREVFPYKSQGESD